MHILTIKARILLAFVIALLVFVGCNETILPPAAVSSVAIGQSDQNLVTGETVQLTAVVNPSYADDTSVSWTTSAPSFATVSSTGLVTAVAPGVTTITVTTTDGNKTDTISVTVTALIVPVSSVVIVEGDQTLNKGTTKQLTTTITPAGATDSTVSWATSDNAVATVSSSGLVTAINPGTTVVTVTTTDGNKADSITVTVQVLVSSVAIDQIDQSLIIGATVLLSATITPADAMNKNISWASSDGSVATVSNAGLVTAGAAGTTTITVTTSEGNKTDSILVTVTAPPKPVTSVAINGGDQSIFTGDIKQLTTTITPNDATDQSVSWATSNATVATVSSGGLVTAGAVGTAIITVTTTDGNKTASVTITVQAVAVISVAIDQGIQNLITGATKQLSATVNPSNATDQSVSWTSSDAGVATVDGAGLVTAGAVGMATITVTTNDGNKTSTVTINVTATPVAVTGISIPEGDQTLIAGNTVQLTASVLPGNATDQSVTWTSSDDLVATVSTTGFVNAVAPGLAGITVTTTDGGLTDSVSINVESVAVTGVSLPGGNQTLTVGDTVQLAITITPNDATNKDVFWAINDTTVAVVDGGGLVTAIGAGTGILTVTTFDGGITAIITITVTALNVPVTGIEIFLGDQTLFVGESVQMTGQISPEDATNDKVSITFSTPGIVAEIDEGMIIAIAVGVTTLTVTTEDGGFTDTVNFTVSLPTVSATSVIINEGDQTLSVGDTTELTATVGPLDASVKNVSWSSSNNSIAVVTHTGLVAAVGEGTATITATTTDGSGITDSITVTVTAPVAVTSIAINEGNQTLGIDDTIQLTAVVEPSNATDKGVTWDSDNNSFATVSNTGLVTAVGAGTATITVMTDDEGWTDSVDIIVTAPVVLVTGVVVDQGDLSLVIGSSRQLSVTISPSNATNQKVSGTSSDSNVATISEEGLLTAVALGTATVSAVSDEGGIIGSIIVTVIEPYLVGDTGPEGGIIIFAKNAFDTTTRKWDTGTSSFIDTMGVDTETPWRFIEAAPTDMIKGSGGSYPFAEDVSGLGLNPALDAFTGVSALGDYIGANKSNTDIILDAILDKGFSIESAAQACRDIGTEALWSMPSLDEVMAMYLYEVDHPGTFTGHIYRTSSGGTDPIEGSGNPYILLFKELIIIDGTYPAGTFSDEAPMSAISVPDTDPVIHIKTRPVHMF